MRLPHGQLHFQTTRPLIMGILNVTPDSFSDGGHFLDASAAVRQAERMIAEGADLIDIGPESSRPGAAPVEPHDQIRRCVPVIAELRDRHPHLPISVDTRTAAVARAALEAGADVVNDITALAGDEHMAALVCERRAGLVLMHMQGTPATMQHHPAYEDVVAEVLQFLRVRATRAVQDGVPADRIIVDPGLGFGKTRAHNVSILRRLEEFATLGYPLLVGASRKSFLGTLGGGSGPGQRLGGSLACVARACAAGAALVRVHDVRETRQFIDTWTALDPSRKNHPVS